MDKALKLPPHNARSRILWSIPAGAILVFWAIGILAAGATSFPVLYTFPEILTAIAQDFR